jgi:uncharacterized MAPEG superfamily protein
MTTEFKYLIFSLALAFVQMLVAAVATWQFGLSDNNGNSERGVKGWAGRAQRAHRAMLANIVLFAPLIFIADIAGRDNKMTETGAQLFFWSSLAYALIEIIGVPRLPTAIWSASAVSLVLIFLQLT